MTLGSEGRKRRPLLFLFCFSSPENNLLKTPSCDILDKGEAVCLHQALPAMLANTVSQLLRTPSFLSERCL